MTLDELLKAATYIRAHTPSASTHRLVVGILDLLGESQPCGFEKPSIIEFDDGSQGVLVDESREPLDPAETRAYAAMLLRAADEADAISHSKVGGK